MSEDETVSDFGVLIPRGGWEEKGWMVGVQMRLAVPRRTDWTASGALDWGFPHSVQGGVKHGGGKGRGEKRREGMDIVVSDPWNSYQINQFHHAFQSL